MYDISFTNMNVFIQAPVGKTKLPSYLAGKQKKNVKNDSTTSSSSSESSDNTFSSSSSASLTSTSTSSSTSSSSSSSSLLSSSSENESESDSSEQSVSVEKSDSETSSTASESKKIFLKTIPFFSEPENSHHPFVKEGVKKYGESLGEVHRNKNTGSMHEKQTISLPHEIKLDQSVPPENQLHESQDRIQIDLQSKYKTSGCWQAPTPSRLFCLTLWRQQARRSSPLNDQNLAKIWEFVGPNILWSEIRGSGDQGFTACHLLRGCVTEH